MELDLGLPSQQVFVLGQPLAAVLEGALIVYLLSV
jgi:hypothetical protein